MPPHRRLPAGGGAWTMESATRSRVGGRIKRATAFLAGEAAKRTYGAVILAILGGNSVRDIFNGVISDPGWFRGSHMALTWSVAFVAGIAIFLAALAVSNRQRKGDAATAAIFTDTADSEMEEILDDAKQQFDVLAPNAAVLTRFQGDAIRRAVLRGVTFRFLLYDMHNDGPVANFGVAIGRPLAQMKQESQQTIDTLASIRKELAPKDVDRIQWKFVPAQTPLYSMWIGDRAAQRANIKVHRYRGNGSGIAFRFRDEHLYESLSEEFEAMWKTALPGMMDGKAVA